MKRILSLLLAAAMLLPCAACGKKDESGNSSESVELIVFAAASMTETLNAIAENYKSVAPNVTLVFNFDSSGTLKTQIQEGADCDLFISAAQKQMNELDIASGANPDGLDFVMTDTRVNLLENKVALVVPAGNPAGVSSFDELATDKVTSIALGNSDVPVGQYSEEIFTNMGVWDTVSAKATFGSNVKEVTTWVDDTAVDCGVVYGTDAYSAGLEVVAYAPSDMLATPVIYPAAVLKGTQHEAEAKAFLAYLQGDECRAVFEQVGFSIPS